MLEAPQADRLAQMARGMIVAALLVMFAISAVSAIFRDRSPTFDEMGLFNPIYLYFQDGKMTYPAHGHYDAMVVHPPMVYWIIGNLMKLGISPFHAAGLLLTFGSGLIYWQLIRGPFDDIFRLSIGMGTCVAVFFINWLIPLRPDVHLAVFWFAGLLIIERARLTSWSSPLCFLGSMCLTLSASFHYIGPGAILAVLVYAGWMLCNQSWALSWRPLLAMIAGGIVVGVPYLIVWAIPQLQAIISMTSSVQGEGGITGMTLAFMNYLEAFRRIHETGTGYYEPLVAAFLKPLVWLRTTPVVIALPILLIWRPTRVLALAALPHLLFIIFFVRGGLKQGYLLYYTPEFILYASALSALVLVVPILFVRQSNFWHRQITGISALAFIGLLISSAFYSPKYKYRLQMRDWEFARYAGQTIMGGRGIAAMSSAGPWYTSGARQIHFIQRDIIERPSLAALDLRGYFTRFDGAILYGQNSNLAYNDERFSLSSGMMDGLFKAKGFYFDDPRDWFSSRAGYVILHPKSPADFTGFAMKDGHYFKYVPDPAGDRIFALWVGEPPFDATWWRRPLFLSQFQLPGESPTSPAAEVIHSLLFETSVFSSIRDHLSSTGLFLKVERMRQIELTSNDWVAPSPAQGDSVHFPTDVGSILRNGNHLKPLHFKAQEDGPGFILTPDDCPAMSIVSLMNSAGPDTSFDAKTGDLTTPAGQWAYALLLGPIHITETGNYWFEIEHAELRGRLAFGALSADQTQWLAQTHVFTAEFDPDSILSRNGFELKGIKGDSFWLIITNNQPMDRSTSVRIEGLRSALILPHIDDLPPANRSDDQP